MDGVSAGFTAIVGDVLLYLAALFIFLIGVLVLVVLILFILDIRQTRHAVRRNYPVIGRLRYLFEHLGSFFRQYFFAMDREELPFNRAQRSWVYRAAKNIDNTAAFGSTRDLRSEGTVIFVNAPYASLNDRAAHQEPLTIGAGGARPYAAPSLFNIS